MTSFLTLKTPLPSYMVFPRFLLNSNFSETTKILYMLLLDRARLSIKNKGWTNEQGHIFIYFTISDMATALHKGEMTIKNSLSVLEKAGLILRQRQGIGQPNKIFVKFPSDSLSSTDNKLSFERIKIYPPDRQKINPSADNNLSSNKNIRHKNYSTNISYHQRNYENEEYESL